MRAKQTNPVLILAIVFLFAGSMAYSSVPEQSQIPQDSAKYVSYHGFVKDARSNDELAFAAIEAEGSNVATVSNIDGEFTLKLDRNSDVDSIKVSYIGYKNKVVPLSALKGDRRYTIELERASAQIDELTVRPVDGPRFIDEVLRKVAENYNTEPQMMTGFYRETVKNRRNYVAISEAVVDIYKAGYNKAFQIDQVKINRGRKSADVEKMDTVLFKLQGGPAVSLLLDIVKNPYSLLTPEYEKVYDFYLEDVISLNNRLHYVVGFNQKPYINEAYYYGKLYIDMDKLAISDAEFSLNLDDKEKAESFFIQRKPIGMSVIPQKASYRASYTLQNGKWYFNYARAEVKLKIDWDKRLFNSIYSIMTEIAITDRKTDLAEKIDFRERFKRTQVLDEMVYVYFDPDYWGEYNVIQPDQSIESAIRKLNRNFEE